MSTSGYALPLASALGALPAWPHFSTSAAAPRLLAQGDFLLIGIAVLAVAGLVVVILALAHALGPRRVGRVKHATYESGMEPVGTTRRRFNIRFYLIAVLFLIFDVEIVFLYPWAVLFPRLRAPEGAQSTWAADLTDLGYTPLYLLVAIGIFFALLLVGLYYEWRRGVFKWN
ncbi:MAG: NADH-quinone oxidoreductase subunit A [Planctomycetota bacterium]